MLDVIYPAPTHNNSARETHILFIEDSPFIRAATRKLLNQLGHCPDCAANGKQALAFIKNKTYDVVLTDIGLPDINYTSILTASNALSSINARRGST